MIGKRFYADTETTGTDPKRNGIIQFTAIVTIDGVEKGRLDLKIMPFTEDAIEDKALEINGITREELFSADRLIPKMAHAEIVKFLGKWCNKFDKKDKYAWYGFKAAFDSDFTREFFAKCGDTYFGSWLGGSTSRITSETSRHNKGRTPKGVRPLSLVSRALRVVVAKASFTLWPVGTHDALALKVSLYAIKLVVAKCSAV